jgi:hypothetical protein
MIHEGQWIWKQLSFNQNGEMLYKFVLVRLKHWAALSCLVQKLKVCHAVFDIDKVLRQNTRSHANYSILRSNEMVPNLNPYLILDSLNQNLISSKTRTLISNDVDGESSCPSFTEQHCDFLTTDVHTVHGTKFCSVLLHYLLELKGTNKVMIHSCLTYGNGVNIHNWYTKYLHIIKRTTEKSKILLTLVWLHFANFTKPFTFQNVQSILLVQ